MHQNMFAAEAAPRTPAAWGSVALPSWIYGKRREEKTGDGERLEGR